MGLAQTAEAIFLFHEMVERPQQQHCIGDGITVGKMTRVPNLRGGERMFGVPC